MALCIVPRMVKIFHFNNLVEKEKAYNLGGHNEKANIEIVSIILNELVKPESLISYVSDSHNQRYAIDPSKVMENALSENISRITKRCMVKETILF